MIFFLDRFGVKVNPSRNVDAIIRLCVFEMGFVSDGCAVCHFLFILLLTVYNPRVFPMKCERICVLFFEVPLLYLG